MIDYTARHLEISLKSYRQLRRGLAKFICWWTVGWAAVGFLLRSPGVMNPIIGGIIAAGVWIFIVTIFIDMDTEELERLRDS